MDILENSKIFACGTKVSATILFFCTLYIVSIINWVQRFLSRLCFRLQGKLEETCNPADWEQFFIRDPSVETFLPISPEEGSRAGLRNAVHRPELRRWIKSTRRRRSRSRSRRRRKGGGRGGRGGGEEDDNEEEEKEGDEGGGGGGGGGEEEEEDCFTQQNLLILPEFKPPIF